jgi:hypothetical protein
VPLFTPERVKTDVTPKNNRNVVRISNLGSASNKYLVNDHHNDLEQAWQTLTPSTVMARQSMKPGTN